MEYLRNVWSRNAKRLSEYSAKIISPEKKKKTA